MSLLFSLFTLLFSFFPSYFLKCSLIPACLFWKPPSPKKKIRDALSCADIPIILVGTKLDLRTGTPEEMKLRVADKEEEKNSNAKLS